jgi:hypothetical protein
VVKAYSKIDSNYESRANKASRQNIPVFKFGIQVPQTPEQAFDLDIADQSTYWSDGMNLEIGSLNEYDTFHVLKPGEPIPEGYRSKFLICGSLMSSLI